MSINLVILFLQFESRRNCLYLFIQMAQITVFFRRFYAVTLTAAFRPGRAAPAGLGLDGDG